MKLDEAIKTPISLSLAPYTGAWTQLEAAHLLRRTMFGPTLSQINTAVTDGLTNTISQLFTPVAPGEPLVYSTMESIAPFGSSWINAVCPTDPIQIQDTENARRNSMYAWQMEKINKEGVSIHEKICLFWQNHFAANTTVDMRASYEYTNLIQTHSLGNFKQFVKDMTTNFSMLLFLNGAQNNRFSPNENYARELLELYTIGKGPQIGVGDYTNYTETDVLEGAKILTGWTVKDFLSNTTTPSSYFDPILHDSTNKTLSAHFNNANITNGDDLEFGQYIDVIFQQDEVARFISRKLYRWFVNYDLTSIVESTIIAEMALDLVTNNYEILPTLEKLLKSEHFYDISVRGSLIKNPIEFIFSIFNATETRPNFALELDYKFYLQFYWACGTLGQDYFQPPNVGGWPAYYQAPNFSKMWVNSSYIKVRFDLASYVTIYGGLDVNGTKLPIDHLNFLDNLSIPSDPVQVIEDISTVFSPKGLSTAEKTTLKFLLTNGLPDFEWTLQYNEYKNNPGNTTFSDPVKQRIALTLDQLFKLPEFQTI